MLGIPLATSEGIIDVVTNTWAGCEPGGKTSGINVRHCKGFWDSRWEGNEYERSTSPNLFICASHRLPS